MSSIYMFSLSPPPSQTMLEETQNNNTLLLHNLSQLSEIHDQLQTDNTKLKNQLKKEEIKYNIYFQKTKIKLNSLEKQLNIYFKDFNDEKSKNVKLELDMKALRNKVKTYLNIYIHMLCINPPCVCVFLPLYLFSILKYNTSLYYIYHLKRKRK